MLDIGQKSHRLMIISKYKKKYKEKNHVIFICRCDCGNLTHVDYSNMKCIFSCGCLNRENAIKRNTTHGMTGTKEHNAWKAMLGRCTNKNIREWHRYGGRGIKVCARWYKFENFYKDMGKAPRKLTLDRINNDGNYEPKNCRWASRKIQANNRKNPNIVRGHVCVC